MPKHKSAKKSSYSISGVPSMQHKSLHVEPAENGYIIRCYYGEPGKDKTIVAKSEEEAKSTVMELMGLKN